MLIYRALSIVAIGLCCLNPTLGQELKVDVAAIKNLVAKWNEAHTVETIDNFSSLYSDRVDFYGSNLKRSKCLSAKRAMLKKYKDFNQVLKTDLLLSGYSSGAVRCDFTKTVTRDNKTTDYESYLIIERIQGTYLIVGESDLTTDSNIRHKSDLGTRVTIKDGKDDVINEVDTSASSFIDVIIVFASLIIGIAGLVTGLRRWRRPLIPTAADRKVDAATTFNRKAYTRIDRTTDYETGLTFEKYIVKQFAVNSGLFTLLEWRSDKFHEGIYPQSNRNPDLVYEYKLKDYVQRFSIECKYRSRLLNNSVMLMKEEQYKIYDTYHVDEMPVYIVLGIGGKPNQPESMYLIPFKQAKIEMTSGELSAFKMTGPFFYDMHTDRLTWYARKQFS